MDKKIVKQLIGRYDKKQLEELICYLVSRNPLAQQELLKYCQKNEKDESNHNIIIENQIRQYWEKVSCIIEEFDMYGGGPESEEEAAYDDLENIRNLLEENDDISWECRQTVLDEVLGLVASDNSGFTDELMDLAFSMCRTREENLYLADYLSKYANSYYRKVAADIYLKNGEEDRYLQSKLENLEYSDDYLELAEYYKKKGNQKQALNIVLQGLERGTGRLDDIYQYLFRYYEQNNDEASLVKLYKNAEKRKWNQDTITELMYNYYKKKGDYAKKKEVLIRLFAVQDTYKLHDLYLLLKKELKLEDFQQEENPVLQVIKNRKLSVYFDILLEKEQPEEVMEYLLKHRMYRGYGIDEDHYFTKRLTDKYPREVVEMYWEETAFYVGLGKEQNYFRAVGILKEIRQIMKVNGWNEDWERKYDSFINQHRRKKLLVKQLEGFKR